MVIDFLSLHARVRKKRVKSKTLKNKFYTVSSSSFAFVKYKSNLDGDIQRYRYIIDRYIPIFFCGQLNEAVFYYLSERHDRISAVNCLNAVGGGPG